ncbi:hypothetical protein J3E69DRAFT_279471 [Trichoderma sp. SZMC 28015]
MCISPIVASLFASARCLLDFLLFFAHLFFFIFSSSVLQPSSAALFRKRHLLQSCCASAPLVQSVLLAIFPTRSTTRLQLFGSIVLYIPLLRCLALGPEAGLFASVNLA